MYQKKSNLRTPQNRKKGGAFSEVIAETELCKQRLWSGSHTLRDNTLPINIATHIIVKTLLHFSVFF